MSGTKSIFRILLLGVLTSLMFTATACNTVKGAGKDIEKGGEKLQDASDAAK